MVFLVIVFAFYKAVISKITVLGHGVKKAVVTASAAGIFGFLVAATASGSDSFKANGNANNTNTATGNVTVTVIEVKDNGNLVVEGTQSIWNNKNEHRITVQGVVRPDDISPDNTIVSSKVADATLRFDGKGPLNAKQRQGILTQIFNILF